jgi:predicted GTPase
MEDNLMYYLFLHQWKGATHFPFTAATHFIESKAWTGFKYFQPHQYNWTQPIAISPTAEILICEDLHLPLRSQSPINKKRTQ